MRHHVICICITAILSLTWSGSASASGCTADIANNDGQVNVADLLQLLSSWGTNGAGSDIAPPNNTVNVADLLGLLAQWGACPFPDCGNPGAGDCCESNGSAFCDDEDCCKAVCSIDSFCCDVTWDNICADEAAKEAACDCPSGPANDDCEDRVNVFNGATPFSNVGATTDGLPHAACEKFGDDNVESDIWFNYVATCTGNATFSLCGSTYDTKIAVYNGCSTANCPPGDGALLACNDDTCDLQSQVTVNVTQGNCYKIRIGGFAGAQGEGVLTITCQAGNPACPGEGSCFVNNGTPGCSNQACCNTVCDVDPFCCNTSWDSICAAAAAELCADCGDPGAGSCFESNGSAGCDDLECCQIVCPIDPFCCAVTWDSLCASEAAEQCANCGSPEAGSCFQNNGTPGCNNLECCADVCAEDNFCCEVSWDGLCANAAAELCANCGTPDAGGCFESNGSPGCDNLECCQAVCAVDPFCCQTSWDGLCANQAAELCANCGSPEAGSCFFSNGTPGCDDLGCCQAVCDVDPFCCEVSWDGICANQANDLCGNAACPGNGDCFESNGSPGCNSEACCNAVCEDDPFCCNNTWDNLCAQGAYANCTDCGDPDAGSCFQSNGSPGCDDADCCASVCIDDPFCCNTSWDGICASAAQDICQ